MSFLYNNQQTNIYPFLRIRLFETIRNKTVFQTKTSQKIITLLKHILMLAKTNFSPQNLVIGLIFIAFCFLLFLLAIPVDLITI